MGDPRSDPQARTWLRGRWRRTHLALALVVLAGAGIGGGCAGSRASRFGLPDDPDHVRSGERGILHTVEKGQTLWRIARTYGVSLQTLAELNDIQDPALIRVGQALWIPGADRPLPVPATAASGGATSTATGAGAVTTRGRDGKQTSARSGAAGRKTPPAAPGKSKSDSRSKTDAEETVRTSKGRFLWPVKGVLYSRYGVREGVRHDGIDIAAPEGSPVMAADDGDVIFAGTQRGYGNLVLLQHADGLVTIYAHNQRNLVEAGRRVRRGERIATVGRTGRATGPHVHFEVRENRLPRNPLFFLP